MRYEMMKESTTTAVAMDGHGAAPPLPPSEMDPTDLVRDSADLALNGSKLTSGILSVEHAASILASIPLCPPTPHHLGLRLVDAVVSCTQFNSEDLAKFWRSRSRWAVLEFSEETISSQRKHDKVPVDTLVRIGHCNYGGTMDRCDIPEAVIIKSGRVGEDLRREMSPGDNVVLRVLPDASSGPDGQSLPQVFHSPIECTVVVTMPLIIRPCLKLAFEEIIKALPNLTQPKVRVDRCGSRIVYNRQLQAFSTITSFAGMGGTESRSNSPTPTSSGGIYGPADGSSGKGGKGGKVRI